MATTADEDTGVLVAEGEDGDKIRAMLAAARRSGGGMPTADFFAAGGGTSDAGAAPPAPAGVRVPRIPAPASEAVTRRDNEAGARGSGAGAGAGAGGGRPSSDTPATATAAGGGEPSVLPAGDGSPEDLAKCAMLVQAGAGLFRAGRAKLPIFKSAARIAAAVKAHRSLIITGETGSGKTTQIPQYLFAAGLAKRGRIVVTQPRRVAAITVAQRVAAEMGSKLGETVGYTIRFDDKTGPATRVKFATDGMLLREAQLDPLLKKYRVIVLDEAHERTLSTDVLFAVVKRAQQRRPKLKVVVMSATLDVKLFQGYFGGVAMAIPGRQHPVTVMYTREPQPDVLDSAMITVLQIHTDQKHTPGDVMVFLSGQEDIEALQDLLERKAKLLPPDAMGLKVCPLFAALPPHQQLDAFSPAPKGCRKVLLCTNIAETSVTVNGVRFVVDLGQVKVRSYMPTTGMELLAVTPVSKAQAWQRAGRAGREAAGTCFRLYQESAFEGLRPTSIPEVRRVSLASVALRLKAMGVSDVHAFPFLEPPTTTAINRALERLVQFTALDKSQALTKLGKAMAALPLTPMFAYAVLRAREFGCTYEIVTLVALLSADNIFYSPKDQRTKAARARRKYVAAEGDHLTMLSILRAFEASGCDPGWCRDHFINVRALKKAMAIRDQLSEVCTRLGVEIVSAAPETEPVLRAIVAGCFLNVAKKLPTPDARTRAQYKTLVGGQLVSIHPTSVLFGKRPLPSCVVFNELVVTSRQYIRAVTAAELSWLPELAPQCFGRVSAGRSVAAAPGTR